MLIDELVSQVEHARKQLSQKGKQAFEEYTATLFEQYPVIEDFRWVQYTPYFNDGDPCEFMIGEICVKLRTGEYLGDWYYDGDGDEEECFEDSSLNTEKYPAISQEEKKVLEKVHSEFADKVNSLGDFLQELFEDHVKIYITREGVDIQEYSHD